MPHRPWMPAACCALFAGCAAAPRTLPTTRPAAVDLTVFGAVVLGSCVGDGAEPFARELTAALRAAPNPHTGQDGIEVVADLAAAPANPVVLTVHVDRHGIADERLTETVEDLQGLRRLRTKRQLTACVAVRIEAGDRHGDRCYDRAELAAAATVQYYTDLGPVPQIDTMALLAAARAGVIADYLQRTVPQRELLAIDLLVDDASPDVTVGIACAQRGDWPAARLAFARAVDLLEGAPARRARASFDLGLALMFGDDPVGARAAFERARPVVGDGPVDRELQRLAARVLDAERLRGGVPAHPW